MHKSIAVTGAVLSAALLLTSCGDDTSLAAKNLRSEIMANSAMTATSVVTEKQADCVAEGMVEEIGVERLRDYDILTQDLKVNRGLENVTMDRRDADALADVFLACIDLEALLHKQLTAGSTTAALSAEHQECVGQAVTEDVAKEMLVAGFEGRRKDAYTAFRDRMSDCAVSVQ